MNVNRNFSRGGFVGPSRQRGMIVQALFLILVMGTLGVVAFNRFSDVQTTAENQGAFDEVVQWLSAMTEIAIIEGHVFTGLDQTDVVERTTIDAATNQYGLTIAVAVSGGNWQLTYPFPSAEACEYVESRIDGHPGLTATAPACNGTNQLIATVE